MPTSPLSPPRGALNRLLSLTDEDGSPAGPTEAENLNNDGTMPPSTSHQNLLEVVLERMRQAIGLEELPDGSVSFTERLHEGEEIYGLQYYLSSARYTGRKEELTGQIDIGKSLTLTRRLDHDQHREEESFEVEAHESRELNSGAKVKETTVWKEAQMGPLERQAAAEFFLPAIEYFEGESHRE